LLLDRLSAALLGGATVWSIFLAGKISGIYSWHVLRRFVAIVFGALAVAAGTGSWITYFWVWQ
jgi:hypothetical protein